MALRIMLVDDGAKESPAVGRALADRGHEVVERLNSDDGLIEPARITQPDVVVIAVDVPSSALLQRIAALNRLQPVPIVLFARHSEPNLTRGAVKAGVSAYVVDGFAPTRLDALLDMAIARFMEHQALREQRDEATERLVERRSIERAKGILMRRRNLPEAEAYGALRKMAMDRGKKIYEVAESVISVEQMLLSKT